MAKQEIYTPTKYIEKTNLNPLIFMAGPIQGAKDWQAKAIKIFAKENPNITLANPRRKYLDGDFDYDGQVDWECFHLKRAGENGVILFWLARESQHDHDRAYAQTTRIELAEWKEKHITTGADIALGIENGFTGARYIRRRFAQDCPEITIHNSLKKTVFEAISIIDRGILNYKLK